MGPLRCLPAQGLPSTHPQPQGPSAARCPPACCLLELLGVGGHCCESGGALRFQPSDIPGARRHSACRGRHRGAELGQALDLLTPALLLAFHMLIIVMKAIVMTASPWSLC